MVENMLARTLLATLLVAHCATSVFGQQPLEPTPIMGGAQVVTYLLQDEAPIVDASDKLDEEFRKMELRLRELEFDVEKRLKSDDESFAEASQTDQILLNRISHLEQRLEQQSEAVDKIETTIPGLVYTGHGKPKMNLFGRIHIDYWTFPQVDRTLFPLEFGNPQDNFGFRRLRLGVEGDINDNMFYKYEGEFAHGINPNYLDAFLGFRDIPLLRTIIIGNQKRPYSLDQLNDSNNNVFMERSLVGQAFNAFNRRLGISSRGFSDDLRFNWQFGVYEQQLTQFRAGYVGDHYQLEFASRMAATLWYDESSGGRGYFHAGVSGAFGVPDGRNPSFSSGIIHGLFVANSNNAARYAARPEAGTQFLWYDTGHIAGANTNSLLGLEAVLNVGPVQLVGEYMTTWIDRRANSGPNVDFDGGYVQASYFLTGEHIPWNRRTGTIGRVQPFENFFLVRDCDGNVQRGMGAWQIAARWSSIDLTDADIIGGTGDSFTFGMNWLWNANARMQFNYVRGNVDRGFFGFGDFDSYGLRFMVDF
jgi:phosphate-selective porin OprO/OprP